jgi:KDO2-lipid IV(A) lauroyltransferase
MWAAWLVVAILRILPRPLAEGLAALLATLLRLAIPRYTRVALRNLELAFPEFDEERKRACVRGCFRNIARILVAVAKFPSIRRENIHKWVRYEGYENFHAAAQYGRGVIFATGHLGNWELSAFAHALMADPIGVVARPLDNPLLDRMSERYRTMSGNRVISRRGSARPLLEMLHNNQAIAILTDQNITEDRGAFVKFFGIDACVEVGLARLAGHTGALIIPGFAVWSKKERRYVLRFYPPIQPTGDPIEDTQEVQWAIEQAVREYPEQWLWIHRRWKTRPRGEPALYY